MANYSLAEIDALARKATRGAGYSWGIAEEAGKSVRWLSAYGLAGAETLAKFLSIVANKPQDFLPNLKSDLSHKNASQEKIDTENTIAFGNQQEPICSLYGGTLINDLGHQLQTNKSISFDNMLFPLLALSQAGRVAEAFGISVAFSYADTVIICDAKGFAMDNISTNDTPPIFGLEGISPNNESLESYSLKSCIKNNCFENSCVDDSCVEGNYADVICNRTESAPINTHFPSPQSRPITAEALIILEKFAHTTYAPATEESRLKGAG